MSLLSLLRAGGSGDPAPTLLNSLMLDSGANQGGTFTPAAGGDGRTWGWQGWVKRGKTGQVQVLYRGGSATDFLEFNADGRVYFYTYDGVNDYGFVATPQYLDASAKMHVAFAYDSTQANAADRMKLWVNRVRVTGVHQDLGVPPLNYQTRFNNTVAHYIGQNAASNYADLLLSQCYAFDGQAPDPTSTTELTANNEIVPKTFSGTYGPRDRFYNFEDDTSGTTLWYDASGNDLHATANGGIDSTNQVKDSPGEGQNYATLNPLAENSSTLSEGNLKATGTCQTAFDVGNGNDWYWEVPDRATAPTAGIISEDGGTTHTIAVTANKAFGFRVTASGNLDYRNITDAGSWTSITTGLSGAWFPYSTGAAVEFNFGQRDWVGTPSGDALNTGNIDTPAAPVSSDYLDAALDTGPNILTATEALFTGDRMNVVKDLDNNNDYQVMDTVRGLANVIKWNEPDAETTYSAPAGNSVGWSWKLGAIPGIVAVEYTGNVTPRTIAHALGVDPDMMRIESLDSAVRDMAIYFRALGANYWLAQNTTAGQTISTTMWNNTHPNASVFSVGTANTTNASGERFIAYLMASVEGFSRFGTYGGLGATNKFVYTGFRPAWVNVHKYSAAGRNYAQYDAWRSPINTVDDRLRLNIDSANSTGSHEINLLGNGFQLASNDQDTNTSGALYIFEAYAYAPFKYANAG